MPIRKPPALSTCAVGSLPHTQAELALQQQLQLDIPTLPQLPRMSPAEFMLAQALEGLPGLTFDTEGKTTVDVVAWRAGRRAFEERLAIAFGGTNVESFEPTALACRAWRPFLWEVEHRRAAFAKAQLTGPLTASWAVTLTNGAPLTSEPELATAVVKLVVVRALAMARALAQTGATPIIVFDEPGLYAFDKRRPSHVIELQELGFAARTLAREGALVGVHCCGNTDWAAVLALPIDILAVDTRLSLDALLATGPALDAYLARGGTLSLGIVPTSSPEHEPIEELVDDALAAMGDKRKQLLARTLLSPACGLALRTVPEAERTFADLREAQKLVRETL